MNNMSKSSSDTISKAAAGPSPKKRLDWVDALKGFAILTVIYIHNLFSETPDVYFIPGKLFSAFHLTLFFMAAGFFFSPFRLKSFPVFLKRKAKTLLFPYVLWGVIIGYAVNILRSMLGTEFTMNWRSELLGALTGTRGALSSWFVLVLFEIYLIEYGLSRLATLLFRRESAVLAFITAVNLALTAVGYFVKSPLLNYFELRLTFLCGSFFFVGCLIRRLSDSSAVGQGRQQLSEQLTRRPFVTGRRRYRLLSE